MRNDLAWFHLLAIVAKFLVDCDATIVDEKIVENRSFLECVRGYEPSTVTDDTEKMFITTYDLAIELGYLAEQHVVETDDGYILTVHRITKKERAPPVFLMHGLLGSSYDWVITGKDKALALKLADAGYDVWLGNARGTTYSRCHRKYGTSEPEFWDFSWHEIGIYDLPAMITFVTNTTDQQLIYIGFSMGTTAFFVMASERPDVASKVKAMMALAPIAFMGDGTSLLQYVTPHAKLAESLVGPLGKTELLSQNRLGKTLLKYTCTLSTVQAKFCAKMLLSAFGFNSAQFNYTLLPDILYHNPSGSSVKVFNHYIQAATAGRLRYYDYGEEKNLKLYNSSEPPDYNISKITVPVGLIWSDTDMFTNPTDVMRLNDQLPKVFLNYRVSNPEFQHLDFVYSNEAPKLVYEKIISLLKTLAIFS